MEKNKESIDCYMCKEKGITENAEWQVLLQSGIIACVCWDCWGELLGQGTARLKNSRYMDEPKTATPKEIDVKLHATGRATAEELKQNWQEYKDEMLQNAIKVDFREKERETFNNLLKIDGFRKECYQCGFQWLCSLKAGKEMGEYLRDNYEIEMS